MDLACICIVIMTAFVGLPLAAIIECCRKDKQ